MTKVLVLGGSGFLGRALCREGIRRGWGVTSLTRNGAPPDVQSDGLLAQVQWQRGSALDPDVLRSLTQNQDYVVHSIGILLESNPLYNLYKQQPIEYAASYRALIRDTAECAADASTGVQAFGYISAAQYGALGAILLPQYMAMKGEAEALLQTRSFRSVILRPALMYGADRWATVPMAIAARIMTLCTAGLFPKPLAVDTVAKAMLNELAREDGSHSSILEVEDIVSVASK